MQLFTYISSHHICMCLVRLHAHVTIYCMSGNARTTITAHVTIHCLSGNARTTITAYVTIHCMSGNARTTITTHVTIHCLSGNARTTITTHVNVLATGLSRNTHMRYSFAFLYSKLYHLLLR